MKVTSIPAHEQSFFLTGIDAQGKKFKKTSAMISDCTQNQAYRS